MKQAPHIFGKDARRLWPVALVIVGLFALFGMSDHGGQGVFLASLVGFACWVVVARLVHEDMLTEESPFWITRPYNRMSLLAAKALFLFAFVFLPLLASGILSEARAGVDVLRNAGHLLAFDAVAFLWLVLPAAAIGAVTNNMKTFAGAVVALFFSSYTSARMTRPMPVPDGPNILAWAPIVLTAVCVIGVQYAIRKTQWSRAVLAVGIIASTFLLPRNSVALASHQIVNPPAFSLEQIQIEFELPHREVGRRMTNGTCLDVPLKVQGLPANTALRELGGSTADVSSVLAATRIVSNAFPEQTGDGYREHMCIPGPFTSSPETLRASLNFEVVAVTDIATIPARPGAFAAGKYGRCEILTPFPENTQLRCDLLEPLIGAIGAGLEYPGYRLYARSIVHESGPFRLSLVSREKFDGSSFTSPGGWPFEEAAARSDAHFVLRTERVIGTIRRDLIYHDFVFPWSTK